jgi:hypothetical protein
MKWPLALRYDHQAERANGCIAEKRPVALFVYRGIDDRS